MKMRSVRHMLLLLAIVSAPALAAETPASDSSSFEPAMRDLWQRSSERFERSWLVAGPVAASAADALDPLKFQPAPGALLDPADAVGARWIPQVAWSDVVDLPAGNASGRSVLFAALTTQRPQAGPVELSFGAAGAVTLWVNGRKVHERPGDAPFVIDGVRIPVTLQQGANTLLLRLDQQQLRAWRYSLRIVEPGTVLTRAQELSPALDAAGADVIVRTDLTPGAQGPQVTVEAVAAGGTIVASQAAARGSDVRFDTTAWRDGAYEFRLRTQSPLGEPRVAYLPWYKGDALAAARKLIEAAQTADRQPAGATVRMLAALVQDRLGKQLENASALGWAPIHSALLEYEELRMDVAGQHGSVRANGFKRLAYVDPSDGSVQFCRAYLPMDYSPQPHWPVIVMLHGYNPANPEYVRWWSVDQRHAALADRRNVIYIEPHGRGNAQYVGMGEQDVLRCLAEAARTFNVDPDRVYLSGESMGGHGTWWIASRHPDLFAAAAPVFGGWDLRVTSVSGPPTSLPPTNPRDAFLLERISSFVSAENLLNLPLYVVHGDADQAVSVENSRYAVKMLQRWGYDIRYHEMPGWGHEDLEQQDALAEWLLTHRRNSAPQHVRLRSADLGGAAAYWMKVDRFEQPMQIIRVDAQVTQPGVVRLDTTNVASATLSLPATLRGNGNSLKVIWNGQARELALADGVARVMTSQKPTPLAKRAGLEGPLPAIVATPFMIVVGTVSHDARMNTFIASQAAELQAMWQQWQHQPVRMVKDVELTPQQQREYSLILIGGAEANSVTRQLAPKLPFKVTANSVTVDGRTWQTRDSVLEMLYPSPVAADRYVLVAAATSADGMYLWKPALVHGAAGNPQVSWDWTVQDGRRPPVGQLTLSPDAYVAAGTFDAAWRRDDRAGIAGNAQTRAGWMLRHAPAPGYQADQQALASYAGRYEIFPGFVADVVVDGDSLTTFVPGQPPTHTVAESRDVFRVPVTGAVYVFERDAQGRIAGISYDNNGRMMLAKRLD